MWQLWWWWWRWREKNRNPSTTTTATFLLFSLQVWSFRPFMAHFGLLLLLFIFIVSPPPIPPPPPPPPPSPPPPPHVYCFPLKRPKGQNQTITFEFGLPNFGLFITLGDVIDSTHMPINKGNAHGAQRERTNGVNFQHSILLCILLSGSVIEMWQWWWWRENNRNGVTISHGRRGRLSFRCSIKKSAVVWENEERLPVK